MDFETALIRLRMEDGTEAWGEAQAPLAPEVACAIVEHLLRPAIEGEDFDGSPSRIAELWNRMYATMRVRGQTAGFMIDAMSGVDLALWDAAGKLAGAPVCKLMIPAPKRTVPAYLSGASGSTAAERAAFAARFQQGGLNLVKLYYESDWTNLLAVADLLSAGMRFAVDALWHMPPAEALEMARDLDARDARWLECPFYPEEVAQHAQLAAGIRTPIALGESYRTLAEFAPVAPIARILQPDLGRCGLTGSRHIATTYRREIVPHVSIAMGPQIAAALHFAAATEECQLCEFNPSVLEMANRFLAEPILMRDGHYVVPALPGLGIVWNDAFRRTICSTARP